MAGGSKRKAWSLEQKAFAINLHNKEPSKRLADVALAFKLQFGEEVATTTLSDWFKPKALKRVLDQVEKGGQLGCKRQREPTNQLLEKALFLWFKSHEHKGSTITGDLLIEKAKKLATIPELCAKECVFSHGWLSRFKQRYGISQRTKHGEAGSAPEEGVQLTREQLRVLLSELPDVNGENPRDVPARDIFNTDETGLYIQQQPTKGLATGKQAGTKVAKKRLTVALTVNATGDQQLPPILINNAQRPRAFPKGFDVYRQLGMQWYWNKKAWMLSTVFQARSLGSPGARCSYGQEHDAIAQLSTHEACQEVYSRVDAAGGKQ